MQINRYISVTTAGISCSRCGHTGAQELRSGARRPCRHASAGEVRRILALLDDRHRRRMAPHRTFLREVESRNLNGKYRIFLLPDGTFACQCLSFLGSQNVVETTVRDGVSSAACKHIRRNLRALQASEAVRSGRFRPPRRPSDWQKLVMKALAVDPHERLTNDQAYFAIGELLARQGVDYPEFEERMRSQELITLLPVNAFGLEFEGCGIPHHTLAGSLTEAGLPCAAEHYNHQTRSHFKVVHDSSVQGDYPFELVTPKLFGADGFAKVEKLCRVVRGHPGEHANASAGLHVHVDCWNLRIADARRVLEIWHRFQPVIQMLVPPSRRTNGFCMPVADELIRRVRSMRSVGSLQNLGRYHAVNLNAYGMHKTIEFRLHSSTFNPRKITSWVVFVLLLVKAARSGLDPSRFEATWEGLAGAVGLSNGTSLIERAHRYLTRRYRHFTNPLVQAASTEASEAA